MLEDQDNFVGENLSSNGEFRPNIEVGMDLWIAQDQKRVISALLDKTYED